MLKRNLQPRVNLVAVFGRKPVIGAAISQSPLMLPEQRCSVLVLAGAVRSALLAP